MYSTKEQLGTSRYPSFVQGGWLDWFGRASVEATVRKASLFFLFLSKWFWVDQNNTRSSGHGRWREQVRPRLWKLTPNREMTDLACEYVTKMPFYIVGSLEALCSFAWQYRMCLYMCEYLRIPSGFWFWVWLVWPVMGNRFEIYGYGLVRVCPCL